jgi:outer membrane PBP1 activator LpoA protein
LVVLLASLIASLQTACSLVQAPDEPTVDGRGQVERLVRDGRHGDAARGYADLAASLPTDHDYYELQSADQWIAAGNPTEAARAFEAVSPDARAKLPILRALVGAELALAQGDGTRALRELDQIAVPTQADEAKTYWWLRGKSAFLAGRVAEGVHAYVERERWLGDPAAVQASRAELYGKIRAAAEHGNPLTPPPKADPVVLGWLALGPLSVELARNPMRASGDLNAWRQKFPQHPATDSLLAQAHTELANSSAQPDQQIALLLPLSGRAELVGAAVRDGFIAAYLEQDSALRPSVRIYDVGTQSVASAYNKAVADGATFVVGPLTKEGVAAVAPLASGRAPVLALNFLGDSLAGGRNLYQFALAPEDEARMVADRVVTDGRLQGVAIFPDGEWGDRVSAAFSDELTRLGGTLLASQRYEAQRADYADIIKQVLQIRPGKPIPGARNGKSEPPTHRSDASFIFIAGTAGAARQLIPQLKFHYAGDIPVYATSDAFEPDPSANNDIDGLLFPDMPWMIGTDPVTTQIRDTVRSAWPARTARRDRLYAFGFDAYRLVAFLRGKGPGEGQDVAGVTGRLHLDEHNRIRRALEWAQIKNGSPNAL